MKTGPLARAAALLTARRLTAWGAGLLLVSWFVYAYTMAVPGHVDREGRFKGIDYVQFYVLGSFALEGRWDALYDASAHIAEARRRIDPAIDVYAAYPNYGPQIAVAFAPLARLPWSASLAAFLILMTACYAASIWILWRLCPALSGNGLTVALLAAAAPLYFSQLRYAQTSPFVLLLWMLALLALVRHRPYAAGLAIGCLAYKPQLGLVVGIAVIASGEWHIVAGAVTTAVGQLAVAAAAAGATAMRQYAAMLWKLAANPDLIVVYPTEVHSLRGFFRLLTGSHRVIDAIVAAIDVLLIVAAVRCWRREAPPRMRWAMLAAATVLVSPHLLTYDLLLLALPLVVCADWAVQHRRDARQPAIALLLVLVYFIPFSANLARLIPVQLSTIVCAALAWSAYSICASAPGELENRRRLGLVNDESTAADVPDTSER